jgi:succinate dehydrogenase hydrophobic anchor subunit
MKKFDVILVSGVVVIVLVLAFLSGVLHIDKNQAQEILTFVLKVLLSAYFGRILAKLGNNNDDDASRPS